jgi:hypothetical protein
MENYSLGNKYFSQNDKVNAEREYTNGINNINNSNNKDNDHNLILLKLYLNRSLCRQQLRLYDEAIFDCNTLSI